MCFEVKSHVEGSTVKFDTDMREVLFRGVTDSLSRSRRSSHLHVKREVTVKSP